MPLVNVLIPLYDPNLNWLGSVISDLNHQTHRDFRVSFIDDGSSTPLEHDWLSERLTASFSLHRLDKNQGITNALNLGLAKNDCEFIFRMDADDRMHPNRIKTQVEFMKKNPAIGVCGTGAHRFGKQRSQFSPFEHHKEIVVAMLYSNPFCHPSVCLRQSSIGDAQYPDDVPQAEDYLFWTLLASRGVKFANLPDILLGYRVSGFNSSAANKQDRSERFNKIQCVAYQNLFGPNLPEQLILGLESGIQAQLGINSNPKGRWFSTAELLDHVEVIIELAQDRAELFGDNKFLRSKLQSQAVLAGSRLRVKMKKNLPRLLVYRDPKWIKEG